MTIKPKALHKGDVIGIIAPASAPTLSEKITKAAEYLERLGYRVKLGTNVNALRGFLAGADQQRADDIHEMFADKNVKAIISVRGGYGTYRLLPLLNYGLIKQNPKILVGYSDITALQLAIYKKTGLVTFSGPMAGVEMWNGIDPFTEEHFWQTVTSTKKIGEIKNPDSKKLTTLVKGNASGILLGGNLSLICGIMGTQYVPSFKNSLLFFEEIDEDVTRFDRMVNHLRISKVFSETNGIIIGELTDVKPSDASKPHLTVEEILQDYLLPLNKPAVGGLVYGHIPRKVTMPIGIRARLNASNGTITLSESAVR